jgi:hypothetical protein
MDTTEAAGWENLGSRGDFTPFMSHICHAERLWSRIMKTVSVSLHADAMQGFAGYPPEIAKNRLSLKRHDRWKLAGVAKDPSTWRA